MKEKICKCIAKSLGNISECEVTELIEIPPEDKMKDFTRPYFFQEYCIRKILVVCLECCARKKCRREVARSKVL
ncbi:hypothetical protein [Lacrimispora brassicae]